MPTNGCTGHNMPQPFHPDAHWHLVVLDGKYVNMPIGNTYIGQISPGKPAADEIEGIWIDKIEKNHRQPVRIIVRITLKNGQAYRLLHV